jgi:hypothetical protein
LKSYKPCIQHKASLEVTSSDALCILEQVNNKVINSIQTMFSEAEKSGGEVSMVVTIGNAYKQ